MLKILRSGLITTVQDEGREGFRRLGISQGGALDQPAMQLANLLVGNLSGQAVLEITLGQFSTKFLRDGWIALTGADCNALLDEQELWTGWRYPIEAGQRLVMSAPKRGMRSYLAIDGGINVDEVLGSRSTDIKAEFGGWQGRALQDGDVLPLGIPERYLNDSVGIQQLPYSNKIRALAGPEYSEFTDKSLNHFWSQRWQLLPQSNRMGFRLQGNALQRNTDREMLSHGLIPGVIQVPHNGQPIILMADAQTTGGYSRIACVIEADLYQLAQLRLGEHVYFMRCTLEEAQQVRINQQLFLKKVEWGLYGH